jgi:hypothetical protein
MNLYEIWVDLAPGAKDLELVDAMHAYLGYLKEHKKIDGYRISRRKFGFGPDLLGEFHITIECATLDQLDQAFLRVATRDAEIEPLHAAVYSRVTNYKAGLWRDFPDEVRLH